MYTAFMTEVPLDKKDIISFGGKPGSGKSTAADLVAQSLGFARYSTGNLFRAISKERGFDVLAGNQQAEKDRSIDDEVDHRQREIGETEDRFVIDGRLAWHFIPNSFKVYLELDSLTAAQRIIGAGSRGRGEHETVHEDPAEYAADLDRRLTSEAKRYLERYGVNPADTTNYNLVVDTAQYTPDEVAQLVIDGFTNWRNTN